MFAQRKNSRGKPGGTRPQGGKVDEIGLRYVRDVRGQGCKTASYFPFFDLANMKKGIHNHYSRLTTTRVSCLRRYSAFLNFQGPATLRVRRLRIGFLSSLEDARRHPSSWLQLMVCNARPAPILVKPTTCWYFAVPSKGSSFPLSFSFKFLLSEHTCSLVIATSTKGFRRESYPGAAGYYHLGALGRGNR